MLYQGEVLVLWVVSGQLPMLLLGRQLLLRLRMRRLVLVRGVVWRLLFLHPLLLTWKGRHGVERSRHESRLQRAGP